MKSSGKTTLTALIVTLGISALSAAEPAKSAGAVPVSPCASPEAMVRNGSFEMQTNPPSKKDNGRNWVFRSRTIADSWIYQTNGGYAETCSDNPAAGKVYLRVEPPKRGFPAFLLQDLKKLAAPGTYLLTMKIRGNGSIEPYITVRTGSGKTLSFGKTKFRTKAGEWTAIAHPVTVKEQGVARLMLRISGQSLDLDDISLTPKGN